MTQFNDTTHTITVADSWMDTKTDKEKDEMTVKEKEQFYLKYLDLCTTDDENDSDDSDDEDEPTLRS